MIWWDQKQKGFTIVELLIVVVVIAILAAITIVAFNGVQNRAKESALQSSVSQARKKIAVHVASNAETAPANLTSLGITDSNDTRYDYTYADTTAPNHYCVSATNIQTPSLSFAVPSVTGSLTEGRCVINYIGNPTAVGPSTGMFGAAGSTHAPNSRSIATDRAHHGTSALKGTVTGSGQLSLMAKVPTGSLIVEGGQALSWSYWVYSTKGGSAVNIIEGYRVSNDTYTGSSIGITIPANTWTKISRTWVPPETLRITQVGFYNLQVVSGDAAWLDEITLHKSDTLLQYGDGESPGWYWSGAANGSTSAGPALLDT